MTLCMSAKFKGGVLYGSDLALATGDSQRHMTSGKWWPEGDNVVLFAGDLYFAQHVQKCVGTLEERLIETHMRFRDNEDDSCDLLLVEPGGITHYGYWGQWWDGGDFAAIGNGADIADALLEMVYSPNRSEAWMRAHFKNIFRIVSKKVAGVSREHMMGVVS